MTTSPQGLDGFLAHFNGVISNGDGWKALCPAHADTNQSLGIKMDGARILIHCYAGCKPEKVLAAVNLQMEDLFLTPRKNVTTGKRIIAEYPYTDEAGKLLFQCVRYEPKSFKQRRPDGAGGWIYDLKGLPRVLFHLPEVLEAVAGGKTVFLLEGEKDCLNLEKHGFTTTTSPMGAGKWRKEYCESLRGADVIILPDNDDAGRQHGEKVAKALYGIARRVRVLTLSGLPDKGDVSDWLTQGHTHDDLVALVDAAKDWQPGSDALTGVDDEESAVTKAAQGFPFTDLGNAERFADQHGKDLHFNVDTGQWHVYVSESGAWQPDKSGIVPRLVRETIRAIHYEAAGLDDKAANRVYNHAIRSEAESRLKATENLARDCEGIRIQATDFDSNLWFLNCRNCVLDLKNRMQLTHQPELLLSKIVPVVYDPKASAERFERFLQEILAGDKELINYLQRFFGYALTGETREQCLLAMVGKGANGKSVLLKAVCAVMGDYVVDLPMSIFLERRDSQTNGLAAMCGTRLVIAGDGNGNATFDESILKALTGDDRISCRFLRQEFFSFTPTCKLILRLNEVPRLSSQSYAMRRRLHVLPFEQTYYRKEDGKAPVRDPLLFQALQDELPGIFAWMVQGCYAWQEQGLNPPARVLESANALIESFDPLKEFLETNFAIAPGLQIETAAVWEIYKAWALKNELNMYGCSMFRQAQQLSSALAQRDGIERARGTKGVRLLRGIGLKLDYQP